MSHKFHTICLLMYGDYPELHREAISGLLRSDLRYAKVRIWCNVVCPETFRVLLNARPAGWWIYVNTENRPKYRLMRDIVHHDKYPIDTPWMTWLDDDTVLMKPNWAIHTRDHLKKNKNIDYCGKDTNGRYYPGAYSVVKRAPWYTGARFGKGISRHVYGAYWWIRTDILRKLDWPDKRLSHNGGDWLLSEALRQQGYTQAGFSYGIKVQLRAKRRGLSEVSVGRHNKKHTSQSDGKIPTMRGRQDYYRSALEKSGIDYEVFDNTTLLVRFPETNSKSEEADERARLIGLAGSSYPSALPESLFIKAKYEQDNKHDRKMRKLENRKAMRIEAAQQKKEARKLRETRMASKTARNAPRPTSPLPRINKTKTTKSTASSPPKSRKTLKRILEERRKK